MRLLVKRIHTAQRLPDLGALVHFVVKVILIDSINSFLHSSPLGSCWSLQIPALWFFYWTLRKLSLCFYLWPYLNYLFNETKNPKGDCNSPVLLELTKYPQLASNLYSSCLVSCVPSGRSHRSYTKFLRSARNKQYFFFCCSFAFFFYWLAFLF